MPTVLLVDDDDAVREAVGDWLSTTGFDVIAVSDTIAGLRQFAARPEIDICVVDLVMPSDAPDGVAFLRSIRDKRPDMPMILMTGYYSAAARINEPKVTLFYKPVALEILADEISRLLMR